MALANTVGDLGTQVGIPHTRAIVRQARMDDTLALSVLAMSVFRETYGAAIPDAMLTPYLARTFAPEAFCAMVADPAVTILVATVDGVIGGYGMLVREHALVTARNGPVVELRTLYIDRTYRGNGLGKALMHAAMTWAAQAAYVTMALCVWRENRSAYAFYQQLGFAITTTAEIVVDGIIFHDWVMTRATGYNPRRPLL